MSVSRAIGHQTDNEMERKKLRAVNEENYKFELASQTKRRTTFCVTANVACVLYEKK